MKKIALFSLMVCLGGVYCVPALAVGNCGTTILHLDGDQRSDHDEFLYTDKRTLERALSDYKTYKDERNAMHAGQYNLLSGYVLECDQRLCPHNSFVYLPNTGYGAHYNAAPTVGQFFLCDGADDDEWKAVQVGECSDTERLQPVAKMYKATNSGVEDFSKNNEYFRIEYGSTFRAYRLCKCPSGKHYEPFETETYHGRCVSDAAPKDDDKRDKGDEGNKRIGTNCQRWLNAEPSVLACCYASMKENPIVKFENGVCSCIEPNTTWDGFSECKPNGNVAECTEDSDCPAGKKCMLVDGGTSPLGGGIIWSDLKAGRCYDAEHIDCFRAAGLKDPTFWSSDEAKCACGNKNGIKYDWRPEKRRCVQTGTVKSCKESRSTAEGKACCDLSAKEAKWENNQCKCLEEGKEFKSVAGAGQCVAKQQEEGGSTEFSDCYYNYSVSIKCANNNTYRESGSELLTKAQLAGLSCADFNARFRTDIKKWQDLYGDLCARYNADVPAGPSEAELSSALSRIESFAKYADSNKSVWKDSEGKFNTARLASDLTAGVVLGTVGGVVSGVVIKKKQIEKGFEVLHCTVGGQKIADWGDTFSVGFQR